MKLDVPASESEPEVVYDASSLRWGSLKKDGREDFVVLMGSYDGAEVCELVGLWVYLLNKLAKSKSSVKMSDYTWDDCLAVVRGSGTELDRQHKWVVKLFKEESLSITV